MVSHHELHGIIRCIPALCELSLRLPMAELSKNINFVYCIQMYIQYRKAEEDNNEK